MTITLTPGKWRGLKTTSTHTNAFAILAFDQRGNYRKLLPENASYEDAVQIKQEVVAVISPHATAVLLDPIYGLGAAQQMAGDSGLLMALEKTGYSGDAHARRVDFIDGWSVEKIKQMGASAVKLLVYYHPDGGESAEHIEEAVRSVANRCKQVDLPLFVEPIIYSPDRAIDKESVAFAKQRPDIIKETVQRLAQAGADVLKIEFPVDINYDPDENSWRSACEAISNVATVPWALLSAGVDFEVFARQVQITCESGASGFLGGRAIWKEAISMDASSRAQFLNTVAVKRMQTLRNIVENNARPWTDFYRPIHPIEDWFCQYTVAQESPYL